MIRYTPRAVLQLSRLRDYYDEKDRPEAIWALVDALAEAEARIAADPGAGYAAPRPYPGLVTHNLAWVKAGSYWVAYSLTTPPVIMGVFYDRSDIPRRL